VLARYNSVNATAQQVAGTPFQQYSTNPNAFVAPVNAQQNAGIGTINNASSVAPSYYGAATGAVNNAYSSAVPQLAAAGATGAGGFANAQPLMNAATGYTVAGGNAVDPSQLNISQYMNPYLGTVLGSTAALINQNNQQAQAGQLGNAITSGAFGGDRAGIAAAVLQGQENLAAGQTYSGIASDAYTNALATAQQQQGVGLGAAQANRAATQQTGQSLAGLAQQGFGQAQTEAALQAALAEQGFGMGQSAANIYASLGSGLQGAELAQGQAQLGAGTLQQQTTQAGDTALYNQFLQQQSYPFQTAQFLANIAEGTGALSGSTTTGTQPGGLFMSDERLKEDMEPIGKGFDGANIYRFRYRGDPTTRIGFSAQEMEHRHPEAVHDVGGFKAVEQHAATEEAAQRGGFGRAANDNGLFDEAPQRRARQAGGYQGFGGVAYPSGVNQFDLAAMLQGQEQGFGPFAESGLYGGKASGTPHGGSSYVPAANVPVSHLQPAALPKPISSDPIHDLTQDVGDVQSLTKSGQQAASWIKGKLGGGGGDSGNDADVPFARGGFVPRRGRQDGGDAEKNDPDPTAPPEGTAPYKPPGGGLDIPDTPSSVQPLKGPDLPKPQQSGFMQFMNDAAQIAKTASGFGAGGRVGFQGGGDTGDAWRLPSDAAWDAAGSPQANADVIGQIGQALKAATTRPPAADPNDDAMASLAWRPGHPSGASGTAALAAPTRAAAPAPTRVTPVNAAAVPVSTFGPPGAAPMTPQRGGGYWAPAQRPVVTRRAAAPAVDPSVALNRQSLANAQAQGQPSAPSTPSTPIDPDATNWLGSSASPVSPTPTGSGAAAPVTPDLPDLPDPSKITGGFGPAGAPQTLHNNDGSSQTVHPGEPGHGLLSSLGNVAGGFGNAALGLMGYQGNGHWNRDQMTSFFTGLAGMLAAPTKYPLVALTQGLAAGTQKYMGLQQQEATIGLTQAQTAEGQAQAARLLPPGPTGATPQFGANPDPHGQTLYLHDGTPYHYIYGYTAIARSPAATAGGAPTGSAAYHYLGPSGLQSAATAANSYANAPAADQENSRVAQVAVQNAATDARSQVPGLHQYADSVSASGARGMLEPGPLNEVKQQWVGLYNDILRTAGLGQYQFNAAGMADAEITHKMATLLSMAQTAGADQHSLEALKSAMSAVPSNQMSPTAVYEMMGQRFIMNQRMIDQANYLNEYDQESQRQGAPPKYYLTRDAQRAYGNEFTADRYDREAQLLTQMIGSGAWSKAMAIMRGSDPDKKARLLARMDQSSPGMSRYLTGGQ
jgi:hypothetical protein